MATNAEVGHVLARERALADQPEVVLQALTEGANGEQFNEDGWPIALVGGESDGSE